MTVSYSVLVQLDENDEPIYDEWTAIESQDFAFDPASTGTVTIPAGEISATIPLTIIDDTLVENSESFTIVIDGTEVNWDENTFYGTILADAAPEVAVVRHWIGAPPSFTITTHDPCGNVTGTTHVNPSGATIDTSFSTDTEFGEASAPDYQLEELDYAVSITDTTRHFSPALSEFQFIDDRETDVKSSAYPSAPETFAYFTTSSFTDGNGDTWETATLSARASTLVPDYSTGALVSVEAEIVVDVMEQKHDYVFDKFLSASAEVSISASLASGESSPLIYGHELYQEAMGAAFSALHARASSKVATAGDIGQFHSAVQYTSTIAIAGVAEEWMRKSNYARIPVGTASADGLYHIMGYFEKTDNRISIVVDEDTALAVDGDPITVDLIDAFEDREDKDALTYSVNQATVDSPVDYAAISGSSVELYLTPDGDGLTTIEVMATDSEGNSGVLFIDVHVKNVNDAPDLEPIGSIDILEGMPTEVTISVSDVDSELANLEFTAMSSDESVLPSSGIVVEGTGSSRILRLTSGNVSSDTPVTVSLTVKDDAPVSSVGADTETFTVTVLQNTPPVALDDLVLTTQAVPVEVNLVSNDIDVDPEPVVVRSITPASGASLIASSPDDPVVASGATGQGMIYFVPGTNGTVRYVPDRGAYGRDSITYTLEDFAGNTSSAQLNVDTSAIPADGVRLLNDTDDPTDESTNDARIVVTVNGIRGASTVTVDADFDGDGVADESRTESFADSTGTDILSLIFDVSPVAIGGTYSPQVRTTAISPTTGFPWTSGWTSLTFDTEAAVAPEIDSLVELTQDVIYNEQTEGSVDGEVPETPELRPNRLRGRLAADSNGEFGESRQFVRIAFEHGDGDPEPDGYAITDENGRFTYDPAGLPVNEAVTIQAWSVVTDRITGNDVTSSVVSLNFTTSALPVIDFATVSLGDDEDGDWITEEPLITGTLTGYMTGSQSFGGVNGSSGSGSGTESGSGTADPVAETDELFAIIEFDHDGDTTTIEGVTVSDEAGSFEYYAGGLSVGFHSINIRVVRWDEEQQTQVYSPWSDVSFELVPHALPVFTLIDVGLGNDNGASDTDGVTSDPVIVGALQEAEEAAGLMIEFAHDSALTVDGRTVADATGSFRYLPVGLTPGVASTVSVRTSQWNPATGVHVPGPWTAVHLTYEEPGSPEPVLVWPDATATPPGGDPAPEEPNPDLDPGDDAAADAFNAAVNSASGILDSTLSTALSDFQSITATLQASFDTAAQDALDDLNNALTTFTGDQTVLNVDSFGWLDIPASLDWTDYPQQAPYSGPDTIPEAGTVLHDFSTDGAFQSALSTAQSNYLIALESARQAYLTGQQNASHSYLQAAALAASARTEALQNAETQQQQMLLAYDPNQLASVLAGIDSLAASSAAPILQRIADLESISVSAGRPPAASEPLPMGNSGAGSDFLLPGNFEGTDWSPSSGDNIQPPAGIPLGRDYLAEIQAEKEDLANDVGTAYYASTLSGNTGSVYDFLIQIKSDENDFDKAINAILKDMGEEVAHYNNETSKALVAERGRLRKVQSDAERLKTIAEAADAHWKQDVSIQANEQYRLAAAQAAEVQAKAIAQADYDLRIELAREANALRRAQMDAQISLSNDQITAAQNALSVWAFANPGAVADRELALFDAQADWIRDTNQKLSDWVDDVNDRLINAGGSGSVATIAEADRTEAEDNAEAVLVFESGQARADAVRLRSVNDAEEVRAGGLAWAVKNRDDNFVDDRVTLLQDTSDTTFTMTKNMLAAKLIEQDQIADAWLNDGFIDPDTPVLRHSHLVLDGYDQAVLYSSDTSNHTGTPDRPAFAVAVDLAHDTYDSTYYSEIRIRDLDVAAHEEIWSDDRTWAAGQYESQASNSDYLRTTLIAGAQLVYDQEVALLRQTLQKAIAVHGETAFNAGIAESTSLQIWEGQKQTDLTIDMQELDSVRDLKAAEAGEQFRMALADDYWQHIDDWKNWQDTPYSQYILDLASAHRTRLTTTADSFTGGLTLSGSSSAGLSGVLSAGTATPALRNLEAQLISDHGLTTEASNRAQTRLMAQAGFEGTWSTDLTAAARLRLEALADADYQHDFDAAQAVHDAAVNKALLESSRRTVTRSAWEVMQNQVDDAGTRFTRDMAEIRYKLNEGDYSNDMMAHPTEYQNYMDAVASAFDTRENSLIAAETQYANSSANARRNNMQSLADEDEMLASTLAGFETVRGADYNAAEAAHAAAVATAETDLAASDAPDQETYANDQSARSEDRQDDQLTIEHRLENSVAGTDDVFAAETRAALGRFQKDTADARLTTLEAWDDQFMSGGAADPNDSSRFVTPELATYFVEMARTEKAWTDDIVAARDNYYSGILGDQSILRSSLQANEVASRSSIRTASLLLAAQQAAYTKNQIFTSATAGAAYTTDVGTARGDFVEESLTAKGNARLAIAEAHRDVRVAIADERKAYVNSITATWAVHATPASFSLSGMYNEPGTLNSDPAQHAADLSAASSLKSDNLAGIRHFRVEDVGEAFVNTSGTGLMDTLAVEAQTFVTKYNLAEATRAATGPASRAALDTEELNYTSTLEQALADQADQDADAYATFAEAQNGDWLTYSADLETASSERRQGQSLAYADYQAGRAQADYLALLADSSATAEDIAIAHGQSQWIQTLHSSGSLTSPYMTYVSDQQAAYATYEATVSAARSTADRAVAGVTMANPTPATLSGGPAFNSSLHATSQSYQDLLSAASQNLQSAATIDEQAIYSGIVQPATTVWLNSTTAEDGVRRAAVMGSHLTHASSLFQASRDHQAGQAPYSGPNPLPTITEAQRDDAFNAADDALEFSHVANDVDWRILTATHNQTYGGALAAAERDSLINAAIRDDVYARAIADADRKLQTWTHAVDVWYMGEVNDAEKARQQSLAVAQAAWRDSLYQANVDAWTAVNNDMALPWTDYRMDEASEQQAAWLDRRGTVIGTTPDPAGIDRLKWLEMQSHVIQAEHDYQTTLIAAYDTMINSPNGVIEARHVQAYAESASRLSSATTYAQDFYQFAVDSAAVETTWQIDSTFEGLEEAGGPAVPGSQATIDADYIAGIEGLQDTFQADVDAYDRVLISGPGALAVTSVDDQSEAQRVYVNAVNNARAVRDNTQQLVRTVYEAGYLEKLDELYSDTGPDGFLDSTATPGPTPWHQYRADMTSAELDRYVDDPVTIPSSMILPPGASTANLDGLSLAELALGATDNEARRVYANSVDDARKTLADDRAQASLDDSLAEFDQDVLDREVDDTPVEVPELLTYQPRDDEPVAPTYELYEPGTIWGDRDWHEQGFNPAADPPEDEPVVEPPTSSEDFLLDTLAQARDEYGDFDFSVNIDYYDVSSSGDPDTTYRDGPYLQHVPTAILGKVRDQKSWDQGNLPGTSTYSSETGSNPWYTASPAVDFPGVFTGNGASAGATLPVYTPPGSPPPSSFGSPPPSGDSSPPAGSFQQPRTSDAGSNEASASQNTAGETQEITDQTTPNDGRRPGEAANRPLEPQAIPVANPLEWLVGAEARQAEYDFLMPFNTTGSAVGSAYAVATGEMQAMQTGDSVIAILIIDSGSGTEGILAIPVATEVEQVQHAIAAAEARRKKAYNDWVDAGGSPQGLLDRAKELRKNPTAAGPGDQFVVDFLNARNEEEFLQLELAALEGREYASKWLEDGFNDVAGSQVTDTDTLQEVFSQIYGDEGRRLLGIARGNTWNIEFDPTADGVELDRESRLIRIGNRMVLQSTSMVGDYPQAVVDFVPQSYRSAASELFTVLQEIVAKEHQTIFKEIVEGQGWDGRETEISDYQFLSAGALYSGRYQAVVWMIEGGIYQETIEGEKLTAGESVLRAGGGTLLTVLEIYGYKGLSQIGAKGVTTGINAGKNAWNGLKIAPRGGQLSVVVRDGTYPVEARLIGWFDEAEVLADMSRSQLGREVLEAATSNRIRLEFSRSFYRPGLLGRQDRLVLGVAFEGGKKAKVFIPAHMSNAQIARTAIHEGLHKLGIRGSQQAEIIARVAERMHMGQPITADVLQEIAEFVVRNPRYQNLRWSVGRRHPLFPGWEF